MKKRLILSLFLIFSAYLNAQCNIDRHSTAWFDNWISCEKKENPNSAHDKSHWIKYSFDNVMKLNELYMWNINSPDILDYGIKTATIDYSLNGVDWLEFGTINLDMATGKTDYEGQFVGDLGGIEAKYLLITEQSNYGGACSGFAELRIQADSVDIELEDCIIADFYPNPVTTNELFVRVNESCVKGLKYRLINPVGKIVISNTSIQLYETKEILNGRKLPPGVYFLVIFNSVATVEYKVIIS